MSRDEKPRRANDVFVYIFDAKIMNDHDNFGGYNCWIRISMRGGCSLKSTTRCGTLNVLEALGHIHCIYSCLVRLQRAVAEKSRAMCAV